MKHTFVVNATISMHVEVEADTLKEAVELAQSAGMMRLCHQCARGEKDEWSTSGELDCDPAASPLVDYTNDSPDEENFGAALEAWNAAQ